MGWAAAFALGAIVAPTDALAATSVFRRIGVPRRIVTLVEGEALFNDATALVAYRAAVLAAVSGSFVLSEALGGFVVAAVGGVAFGALVGRVGGEILRRLDDPPVEVIISVVIPFAAYLPADRFGLSGVLAAVTAGLVIGSRLGKILSPTSRVLWLSTWKMVGFVLNGFVFVLIGLELPAILEGLGGRPPAEILALTVLVCRSGDRHQDRLGLREQPAARIAAAGLRADRSGSRHAAHVRRELGRTPWRRLAGGCSGPAGRPSLSATSSCC